MAAGETVRVAVGVDDTDNLESRGTGHRARQLGLRLEELGLARLLSVTRHQLLVSPEIRYTSHNSSACLVMEAASDRLDALKDACRTFLIEDSALGSDVGLCVARWSELEQTGAAMVAFGRRAKTVVLKRSDAEALAADMGLYLVGLTGDHGGVIGALAGVGLRFGGNDGRFLWLPGLRDLTGERHTPAELKRTAGVDQVATLEGVVPDDDSVIATGQWVRPVLLDGQSVILVEDNGTDSGGEGGPHWQVLPKDRIKQLSS
jgi:hypothetical protein